MDFYSLISGSDVRGVAIGENAVLTERAGYRIGQAFSEFLMRRGIARPCVNIGRDPRLSSPALEQAIADGLASAGSIVRTFGLCTTPAMYMSLLGTPGADASIMVTASHLPWERNGYKFFLPDGGINSSTLKAILAIASEATDLTHEGGQISRESYLPVYTEHLRSVFMKHFGADNLKPFDGLHIIVDAGNGSGGFYADLLASLGANTEGSQFLNPDGHFPNHIPNPENEAAMESISEAVLRSHADLGVIFDTDCDRAAVVDSTGREINRNRLIALIAAILLKEYPGATIVTDSVTSSGLAAFIDHLGGHHHRFKRGYRNVIDEARRLTATGTKAPLAIETSGHAALEENYFLDDGMYLVTRLLCEAIKLGKRGQSLSSLIEDLAEPAESTELRFNITDPDFKAAGQRAIDQVVAYAEAHSDWHVAGDNYEGIRISFDLDDQSNSAWFLLRLSLHDPVLPLNIESDVAGGIKQVAALLADALKDAEGIDLSPLTAILA
ncbi:MAG: phosphomannomutase/phosphoglucomutase [Clostridia bacterium]|nr:phosphomannomutase/phosphoglucomutase [Clostridia bacterium]